MMLERLQKLFQSMARQDPSARRPTRDDPPVAAAALFFHVVDADGDVSPAERRRLRDVIAKAYRLDGPDLDAVMRAAERADEEAVDLYAFTRVLKRALDHEQRVSFVELLWEIVYVDGKRHELEENIVWRVAELLGVSGRQRIRARQKVEDEQDE